MTDLSPSMGSASGTLTNGSVHLTAAPSVGGMVTTLNLEWSTTLSGADANDDQLCVAAVNISKNEAIIVVDVIQRSSGGGQVTVPNPGSSDHVVFVAWFRSANTQRLSPNKVLGSNKAGSTNIW